MQPHPVHGNVNVNAATQHQYPNIHTTTTAQQPGFNPNQSYYQGQFVNQQSMMGQPAMVAMPVYMDQMNRQTGVPGHIMRGMWSDSLFDCFDSMGICLLSTFIPCWRWALTLERSKLMKFTTALLLMGLPWLVIWICQIVDWSIHQEYVLLGVLFCEILVLMLGTVYRGKIREQYQIPGNACEDCLMHSFCNCCAVSQEAR